MKLNTTWQDTARLIRAHKGIQFFGEIHEAIYSPSGNHVGESVFFDVRASQKGIEKSRQRWERDRKILLKKYKDNPRDTRSLFYLAQTEHCLGNYHQAYEYYFIRSHQTGWDEEDYHTHYRLGQLAEILSEIDENFTWELAYEHYIQAHKMRPHLIEPLLRIAEHYWPDNIPLCFLFARRALDLKMPVTERLSIDQLAYNYSVYEIISKSAWTVQEYELGLQATLKALQEYPDMPHLLQNLECYQEALRHKGIR